MAVRLEYDELAAANVTFVMKFLSRARTVERDFLLQVFKFHESSKCIPCVICYNYCGCFGEGVGRACPLNAHTDPHIMAIKHKNCVYYSRHYCQASVLSIIIIHDVSLLPSLAYMGNRQTPRPRTPEVTLR